MNFDLVLIALSALGVGAFLGAYAARRGVPAVEGAGPPGVPNGAARAVDSHRLRAQALEATAEPVLIIDAEGRVSDCNAATLTLLDRHRSAVTGVQAIALRTLHTSSGAGVEWSDLVAARGPWSGIAHVRLPDGSRQVSPVRLVPVFGTEGGAMSMVEVHREPAANVFAPADRFLRALDASMPESEATDPVEGARRELQLLALGFADLDRVVRQYELLLPAMRAEEPLTEAIAGLAAETRDVAASANVPRLLQELPHVLDRLRRQVQRAAGARDSSQGGGAAGTPAPAQAGESDAESDRR